MNSEDNSSEPEALYEDHDTLDLYGDEVSDNEEKGAVADIIEDDDIQEQEDHHESVFVVDDDGNHLNEHEHVQDQEDYGMDFNDYEDDHNDDIDADGVSYSDDYDDTNGLVVPDVGITRESSIASRISNESGIFTTPRKDTIAYKQPTLQTLSEEIKSHMTESDSDFIKSTIIDNKHNNKPKSNNSSRTSTITSNILGNHHDEFVSNARYSQSIISYDDEYNDDDAFSFQANDDKEYEIGYEKDSSDRCNLEAINKYNDDDLTDTNATDTESLHTPNVETFEESAKSAGTSLPPIPTVVSNRDSIFDAHELKNEVEAMRSVFVRSDMHPSILSKSTGYTNATMDIDDSGNFGDNEFEKDESAHNKNEQEGEISSIKSKSTSKSESTIDRSSMITSSTTSSTANNLIDSKPIKVCLKNVENFEQIPDIDLLQMFINNPNTEENKNKLITIRNELNSIDTGLNDWISFNMGNSVKISLDEDKLGKHVREAYNDENITNVKTTFSISDTMENMASGLTVSKIKDVVLDVKVKKIGQRGKTLLRKLKKVPKD